MRFTILFLACGLAFAQLETNTLTITASRNVSPVADQVVYDVSFTADMSATLDDVIGQLAGTGITAANLLYVSSFGDPPRSMGWSFEVVIPFAKMKEMAAALARLKEKLGTNFAFPLVFSTATLRTSTEAQSQACPLSSLVSDARREAERIASAAGMKLGGIVALSDGAGIGDVPAAASRSGTFVSIYDPITGVPDGFGSFLLRPVPGLPFGCSLIVQFRLLP